MEHEAECIHTEGTGIPASQCSKCNGREAKLREERLTSEAIEYTWNAKFEGRCAVCRDYFSIGDRIGRRGDGLLVCECSL
jgi:hypothetical protein